MRTSAPAAPCRPLTDAAQAAASVGLAVYLLGLALSIAGNSVSGSSALVRTIKGRLFSPWMAPAWLDLGFDHPLTYGMPEDADHSIEVRRFEGQEVVHLPGPRSGERAGRWRRLARQIAAAEDGAPPLAAGIGGASFRGLGAEDVIVRVLRKPLVERTGPSPASRPAPAYAARVRRVEGELQVIEVGNAAKRAELAPVVTAPGSPAPPRKAEEIR